MEYLIYRGKVRSFDTQTYLQVYVYVTLCHGSLQVSHTGPSDGMRNFRYPATASRSRTICDMKRWMRRKLDSREALLSNAPASLERHTVCTAQSAPSSMDRHLMWARFMDTLNIGRITEKISLLLCGTLRFRNMVIMWKLYTLKLRNFEVFCKYN